MTKLRVYWLILRKYSASKWKRRHFGQQIRCEKNVEKFKTLQIDLKVHVIVNWFVCFFFVVVVFMWDRNSSKISLRNITIFFLPSWTFHHSIDFQFSRNVAIACDRLNILVVSALRYRTRPITIGQTSRSLRQTIYHWFNEARTTLDT